MGEQDDAGSGLARRLGDQAMTGHAGGGGQAGRGPGAGPGQAAPVRPGLAGGARGETGPGGAVGVEAVIDRQGQKSAAVGPGPVGSEAQQGDGIAAAGQGERERTINLDLKPRGQAGPDEPGPVGEVWRQPGLRVGGAGVAGAAGQPMRVRASVARVRTAALAPSA